MEKVIIKETTRFFSKRTEMQEFTENIRIKPQYRVINCGKNRGIYFVKYRNTEA